MPNREITIKVYVDEKDVNRAAANIEGTLGKAFQSDKLRAFASQARDVGAALSVGITAPLALIAKEVLRVGNEYQQSMNLFQAATKATAEEMRLAADAAKRLGADTQLPATSAGDAAKAMTELAKSGLSAREAIDAARGVLLLAAAAGIKEAEAAEIAGNALNTFGLQAKESARVADLLAAAANASSAEITDVAQAMQQSGASAAALKIPIEDLVTSIGLMANAGIKGSDAGTSLKTAFTSLAAPSSKAADEMQRLGINIFNAQGQMLPMREVVEIISDRFSKLSDQQRVQAANTIFGSDAMRAALIVFGGGVETFDKLKTQVTAQGAAAELAAAKTKGLGGAWEGLKSQLETGALVIFERMAPTIETIVRQLADFAGRALNTLDALSKTNPQLVNMGLAFAGVAAAVGPVMLALAGLATAIATISGPFLAAAAGITAASAALAAAWSTNFLGIRDITLRVVAEIRKFSNENLSQIVKWWQDNLPLIRQTVQTVLNWVRDFWRSHGDEITSIVKNAWEILKTVVSTGGRVLGDTLKLVMQVINGDWKGAWQSIWDIVKAAFSGIVGTLKGLGNAINAAIVLAVEGAVAWLHGMQKDFINAGMFLVTGLVEGIKASAGQAVGAIKSLANAVLGTLNKEWQIKSPSKVFQQAGIFAGDGLAEGFENSRTKVSAAAKKLAKEAADVIRDHGIEMARAYRKAQEEIADAAEKIAKDLKKLADETADLAKDRAAFAAQSSRQWLEERKQVELTLDSYEYYVERYGEGQRRIRDDQQRTRDDIARLQGENAELALTSAERQADAYKYATERIKQENLRAVEDIGVARARMADNMIFHSDRATAAILDHLARQKGVTETVADAFINLYDGVFSKLDGLIDGWTKKLGVFGDFVGTLLKGIVHNLANSILSGLLGPQGILGRAINGIGGWLSKLLGGGSGALGNIFGATTPGFNPAAGGILSGVLGGIFGGSTSTVTGGVFAGATATGTAAGGLGGILSSLGAFASSGLGIATLGIGTAAAFLGKWLIGRARQRRNDEEASGVALEDAVELIKRTATSIDADELKFANGDEAQTYLNDAILQPFRDFINTLKTKSVRDSRLTNQVRDLENLYNSLVGDAIKRQQERIAAAAANPTTPTTTGSTTTPDPFASLTPPTVTIETLNVGLFVGEAEASKVVVTGAKTKDGKDIIVKTVKLAAANGEL